MQRVSLSAEIAPPPERVFAALIDPNDLNRWLSLSGAVVCDAYEGGAFEFDDSPFGRVHGRIEEIEAPHRLTVSFQKNWPGTVAFVVSELPGGCEVRLVHEGFEGYRASEQVVRGFDLGWVDRLADLKALFEPGPTDSGGGE